MTNLYHKREELKAKGMTLIHKTAGREYWGWLDRPNALLDHTATLTNLGGGNWRVSEFTVHGEGYAPEHARKAVEG